MIFKKVPNIRDLFLFHRPIRNLRARKNSLMIFKKVPNIRDLFLFHRPIRNIRAGKNSLMKNNKGLLNGTPYYFELRNLILKLT